MNTTGILGSLLLLVLIASASAGDLGVVGATYEIREADALREVEERAQQTDWGRYFNAAALKKKVRQFAPDDMGTLTTAKENKTFTVDMTYALTHDIPDGKGGILYPKGYTFNPLDYVVFPNTLVFINGAERRQVEWFKASAYSKDHTVMLLTTGGSFQELSEELKRPVFYGKRGIVERFKLVAVPSVVTQRGRNMEVKEIAIQRTEKSG